MKKKDDQDQCAIQKRHDTGLCVFWNAYTWTRLETFFVCFFFLSNKQKPNLVSLCIKEKLFMNLVVVIYLPLPYFFIKMYFMNLWKIWKTDNLTGKKPLYYFDHVIGWYANEGYAALVYPEWGGGACRAGDVFHLHIYETIQNLQKCRVFMLLIITYYSRYTFFPIEGKRKSQSERLTFTLYSQYNTMHSWYTPHYSWILVHQKDSNTIGCAAVTCLHLTI